MGVATVTPIPNFPIDGLLLMDHVYQYEDDFCTRYRYKRGFTLT